MPLRLLSCSSAEESQSAVIRLAEERYGSHVEYLYNESKSFVICFNRPKLPPGIPLQPLRFFVFDMENAAIVFQDSFESADINWLDNTRFAVRVIPGIISEGEDPDGYEFDVLTRKRHHFIENKNLPQQ
jgi:hypothetical protein